MSTSPALEKLRQVFSAFWNIPSAETYYQAPFIRDCLHPISATLDPTVTVTFEFTVLKELCNAGNNMHGGATATIFDVVTTLAISLVSKPGYWEIPGVSRTLDVVYLEAAPEGEVIEVTGEIVKIAKRLAQLRGVMRRKRDGVVVATCEHGKVNIDRPNGGKL
ncbi:MAG: hypothetical protein Q9213_001302 [Squamulea squamosa]